MTLNEFKAQVRACFDEPDRKRAHEVTRIRQVKTILHYDPAIGYWGTMQRMIDNKWHTVVTTSAYITAAGVRKQFEEMIGGKKC